MSRAVMYGALVAAAAAVLVVTCARSAGRGMAFAHSKTPVNIDFSCGGNAPTIGLTDDAGKSAWIVETVSGEIRWKVKNHVTINGILAKPGQSLPIDTDPGEHGGAGGRPYKAKVKSKADGGPDDGATVSYAIDVSCAQNGKTAQLIIDPEFIVRR